MLLAIIIIVACTFGMGWVFGGITSDFRNYKGPQFHDFGGKEDFSERIEEDPYSLFRNTMK